MRVAVLTDIHLALGTQRGEKYQEQSRRIWSDLKGKNPDLILMAGDLTESGRPQEYALFKQMLEDGPAPVWVVPGNHDVGNKGSVEGGITSERLQAYEEALGPSFYARTQESIRVIGLNSSLLGSNLPEEEEQWAFLEAELASDHQVFRVLLTHYPLFIEDPVEAGGGYWTIEPGPRRRLLDLIQGRIPLVLSGHLHRVVKTECPGMTFITGRPASFGLPEEEPIGWLMIEVRDGQIEIEEYRV